MVYSIENPIQVGQKIPDVEVEVVDLYNAEPANSVAETKSIGEVLGRGRSVLLGMPGAYTPTCNDVHLPGFYQNAAALKRLGVDRIALVTTNDRFVNAQWQRSMDQCQGVPEGEGPVTMLSDARGDLAEGIGLIGYLGRGLGVRSKRFALVVEDGVVTYKGVDEGAEKLASTSADSILAFLRETSGGGSVFSLPPVVPLAGGALLLLVIAVSQLF
jgi:peroxiredoxin